LASGIVVGKGNTEHAVGHRIAVSIDHKVIPCARVEWLCPRRRHSRDYVRVHIHDQDRSGRIAGLAENVEIGQVVFSNCMVPMIRHLSLHQTRSGTCPRLANHHEPHILKIDRTHSTMA